MYYSCYSNIGVLQYARALPVGEEQIPETNVNGQPPQYDFFGLGQPGQMPFKLQVNAHAGPQNNANQDLVGSGEWPQDEHHEDDNVDLNQLPDAVPEQVGDQTMIDHDIYRYR
jgi:hypothetical protein